MGHVPKYNENDIDLMTCIAYFNPTKIQLNEGVNLD